MSEITEGRDSTAVPFISVIVPVRNGARFLGALLQSLDANTYPADRREVVVVDHESTDGSADLARHAGAHVIRTSVGPVGAVRNFGVRAASGTILAFVDADHTVGPHWLRAAASALEPPDVGMAGDLCRAPVTGNWVQRTFDRLRARAVEAGDVTWLGSGNMAVSRRAFEAVGGFDESLEVCEDVDLCRRVLEAGWRIRSEPRMENTHFGDPASLGAIVRGERWRGRDNIRVSLRGHPPLRAWPGILMPVVGLVAIGGLLAGLLVAAWAGPTLALVSLATIVVLAAMRALVMLGRAPTANPIVWLQTLAVAVAFELGRALALVAGASHEARSGSQP